MSNHNLQQIQLITEAIDINEKKEILVNGQIAFSTASDPYMQTPSGKILFDALHTLIYRKFYIQACEPISETEPTETELLENIALLSRANTSTVGFDEGWVMENNDANESLIAGKGKYRIQLKPGEFLNVPPDSERKKNNKEVKIYRPKEYAAVHEAFYYAYGNSIHDSDDDFVVRFYFNASFTGNVKLMNLVTSFLNKNELQFIFKCLIHPFYYGRADTSVLYVHKQYAGFVCEHLTKIYPDIEDFLRDDLPLFVYPIKKGIGFAEQPSGSVDESFGTHWCKIIAAGIMNAYENDLEKDTWYGEVLKHIREDYGYANDSEFYKNPKSHYPYSFIKK
jgi:hypothetical protein